MTRDFKLVTAMVMTATAALAVMATGALADIVVQFRDGAPKDRFTITNTGSCASGQVGVTIDLFGSPSGLVFDITGEGAGVEVFQPFELTSGAEMVQDVSEVTDGDTILTLLISDMVPQAEVSFTIDLDDTVGTREITVSGSEIAGAMVMATTQTTARQGTFDDTGTAIVPMGDCLS